MKIVTGHPSTSLLIASDLQQPESLLVSPPLNKKPSLLLAGKPSTSSQSQQKRRRHHIATKTHDDELLNAWLSSEIATNAARVEMIIQKTKVLKLQEQVLLREMDNVHTETMP